MYKRNSLAYTLIFQIVFFYAPEVLKFLGMVVQIMFVMRDLVPRNLIPRILASVLCWICTVFSALSHGSIGNAFDLWILIFAYVACSYVMIISITSFHATLVSRIHYCFIRVWNHWAFLFFGSKFTPLGSRSNRQSKEFKAGVYSIMLKGQPWQNEKLIWGVTIS
jgi:hypothetical protein